MNYIKAAKTVGILFAVLFILVAVIHAIRSFRFMERFEGHFHFINGRAYRIVASTSPSRIEAHAGLFRSLMKGIFDPYVL